MTKPKELPMPTLPAAWSSSGQQHSQPHDAARVHDDEDATQTPRTRS